MDSNATVETSESDIPTNAPIIDEGLANPESAETKNISTITIQESSVKKIFNKLLNPLGRTYCCTKPNPNTFHWPFPHSTIARCIGRFEANTVWTFLQKQ